MSLGREDVLTSVLLAGYRLGRAEILALVDDDQANAEATRAIAETVNYSAALAEFDPVAGQVVREAAYRMLHGADVIDGEARPVEATARELEP